MNLHDVGVWENSWVWGLPLIGLTVIVHVMGLGLIRRMLGDAFDSGPASRRLGLLGFATVMGLTVMLTTILHLMQASIWAFAYLSLRALPDIRSAMLYSLNAMTSFGHTDLVLAPHWQMLGALEALNGIMLFSLSAAFLFGMIQRAWPRQGD